MMQGESDGGTAIAQPTAIEGPAFTPSVKFLSSVLMLALAFYSARGAVAVFSQPGSMTALALMLAALVCLALSYWWILRSRTTISSTHIHQTWIWPKRVALVDITRLKLIYIPGLSWLISPRLVVRTRAPGSTTFHAGDPRLREALVRLAMGRQPLVQAETGS